MAHLKLPIVNDLSPDGEGPVQPHDVRHGLDGEPNVPVVRGHPLQLARLQPPAVAHGGPPDDVQLSDVGHAPHQLVVGLDLGLGRQTKQVLAGVLLKNVQ